jgi:hypothetical protein
VRLPPAYDLLAMSGLFFVHWRASLPVDDGMGQGHAHGHDLSRSVGLGWTVVGISLLGLRAAARFAVPYRP